MATSRMVLDSNMVHHSLLKVAHRNIMCADGDHGHIPLTELLKELTG